MPINSHKRSSWPSDVEASVAQYNAWYLDFAPDAYRKAREDTEESVRRALEESGYGAQLSADFLRRHPGILFVLRMFTAPPVARDRLTGLSGVPKSMIDGMDRDGRLPERMASRTLNDNLDRIGATIRRLMDPELFPWIREQRAPVESEIERALLVVGDRVCRAVSDPVIRNAQEARQLAVIAKVLGDKGYQACEGTSDAWSMPAGTYSFRMNVPVRNDDGAQVNMPIDAVIRPLSGADPVLFEAKSAGDFTNVNKRRKEEATKIRQLRATYGKQVSFMLFLCGYFDTNYLSYEAAEGIDWVWEHRPEELLLAL
ncbi:MAG: XamI family restriction endonuclease [Planctomycetaceae bacterium]|nr:XamI family restriction endonuclease [Planctomycetaceae bacterium]